MHHDVECIDYEPAAALVGIHAQDTRSGLVDDFFDLDAQRPQMRFRITRSEDEVIGDGGLFADAEHLEILGFFLFKRVTDLLQQWRYFGFRRFQFHAISTI